MTEQLSFPFLSPWAGAGESDAPGAEFCFRLSVMNLDILPQPWQLWSSLCNPAVATLLTDISYNKSLQTAGQEFEGDTARAAHLTAMSWLSTGKKDWGLKSSSPESGWGWPACWLSWGYGLNLLPAWGLGGGSQLTRRKSHSVTASHLCW